MKWQEKIIGLFILLLLVGCNQKAQSYSNMDYAVSLDMEVAAEEESIQSEGLDIEVERKLIKDGNVTFETDDINATRATVFESIEKNKGYISSDREYKSNGKVSNTLIIRVPSKNFDSLLSEATQGVSKFDSKNIEIEDVTEEFLDIQARLKTKKELEIRYLEILKKANTVSEILEIEKQMGELRADIESTEGRLKYLESRVSFSTLTMIFYQKVSFDNAFGNKFKDGFKDGWENLIRFFVILTTIWPFILIGIGLIFGFIKWRKRKRK